MTHVSLFSGIGGLDLAAEWAGFETVLFVEKDAYCQKVLRKHWPDVLIIEDIRSVHADSVREPITVISGGFPCQPFSHAGKRRGEADDRFLWPEMLRVISEIKPSWVVAENVPGLLSIKSGMVFERVLSELESCGYETLPLVYPAAGVGAPHRRDRVFIVAHSIEFGRRGRNNGDEGGNGREVQTTGSGAGKECGVLPDSLLLNDDLCGHGASAICGERSEQAEISGRENVADSEIVRWTKGNPDARGCGQREGTPEERGRPPDCDWWQSEPDVGGTLDGFPGWLYRCVGRGLSYGESKRRAEVLRKLWNDNVLKTLRKAIRGFERIQQAQVLFSFVCEYEKSSNEARLLMEGKEVSEKFLRSLRDKGEIGSAPYRPDEREQRSGEHPDSVQLLPRLLALNSQENWAGNGWEDATPRVATGIKNRVHRLRAIGNAVVPQQAYPIFKAIAEVINHV
jgi:DNA (cytosine-5)-methyltransferase 1